MEKQISKYHAGKFKEGAIKLSSNELTLGIAPKVLEALQKELKNINRYPDSSQKNLRRAIAQWLDVSTENLILGNGSDEVISFITQRLLSKGDTVITAQETFSIYEICSQIAHAQVIKIPLLEGYFDLDAMLKVINNSKPKIIFICNPNNPTGTCISPNIMKIFIQNISEQSYIVLDEAYYDFVDSEFHVPISMQLSWHKNIIILKTFSKVFAMGGLRLGIGICNKKLAQFLEEIRMPFNINILAQIAGIAALEDKNYYEFSVDHIRKSRVTLMNSYNQLGFDTYASQANFICLHVSSLKNSVILDKISYDNKNTNLHKKIKLADEMFDFFAAHNIMIRSLVSFGLSEYVRISIGTEEENNKVLDVLRLW